MWRYSYSQDCQTTFPGCQVKLLLSEITATYSLTHPATAIALAAFLCTECALEASKKRNNYESHDILSNVERSFKARFYPAKDEELPIEFTTAKSIAFHVGDVYAAIRYGWIYPKNEEFYDVMCFPWGLIFVAEKE